MNTEHDPVVREILDVMRPPTTEQAAALKSLRFIDYVADRERGARAVDLVGIYPQSATFERQYRENLGAREADDNFSPSGERGRTTDRDEVKTYAERLHRGGR